MKKYISPKADFIEIGNVDILTASAGFDIGIELPADPVETNNFSGVDNADNGVIGKAE